MGRRAAAVARGGLPVAGWGGGSAAAVDAGSAGDAGPACTLGNTMADVERQIFHSAKCFACHGRVSLYPTTLDLLSEGLAARVVDKPAASDPNKGKCAGRVLVPRDDPT